MKTVTIHIEDELFTALEEVCGWKGQNESQVFTDALTKYVKAEQLKRSLQKTTLTRLYEGLTAEDIELAEQGIADYQKMLKELEEAKNVEMFLSNLTPSTLVPKNLIGCARSGKGDISSNKYKYLGQIK